VTVTVTDQAPTCNNTSTTTTVGTAVDKSNLFDCDDADGEPFTIHFGDGDHGVTDLNGTTYAPDPGFVGTDQVLFYAEDGVLQSPIHAITITVATQPPAPPTSPPAVVVTPKDTIPPVFSLTHPKQKLGDARFHGIKLVETSNEHGTEGHHEGRQEDGASTQDQAQRQAPGHHRHAHPDGRRRETERDHQADEQRAQGARACSEDDMTHYGEIGRYRWECHDAQPDRDTDALARS
jgi:hypothetical protein